jgi:hypothetical protein
VDGAGDQLIEDLTRFAPSVERTVNQRLLLVALRELQGGVEKLGFCFARAHELERNQPAILSGLQLEAVARAVESACRRYQAPLIESTTLALWIDSAMRDGSARKYVSELLCALRAIGIALYVSPDDRRPSGSDGRPLAS